MTYILLAAADTYFTTRLRAEAWNEASDADKLAALTMATNMMNQLNFVGVKTDASQELEFPRGGDSTIPTQIQYACAELALAFLDDADVDTELQEQYLTQYSVSSVRSAYDRTTQREDVGNSIPCRTAWTLLRPFLRDARAIRLKRIS